MLRNWGLGWIALAGLVVAVFGFNIALGRMSSSTAFAGSPATVNLQQAGTDVNSGIMVSGVGKIYVKPNIAVTNIGVDITAATLNDATTQANTKMAAVIAKIKSMGVADKDIQTSNFNLNPITQPSPKGPEGTPPAIVGYHVSNQVNVIVRNIGDLGKILDAAVGAGANTVYGVSFSVDDMTPYQQQARAAAVKDAQDKAGQLAKSAGIQLGPVLLVSESTNTPGPIPAAASRAFAAGGGEVPVQTGEMQVIVNVDMRFGIK